MTFLPLLDRGNEPKPEPKASTPAGLFSTNRPGKVNYTLSETPTPDEMRLANQVRDLFYRARQARRPIVSKWNRNYQVLFNRYWGSGRAGWMPTPEVPEVYPITASVVGWMTDQRPTIHIMPSMDYSQPEYLFFDRLARDLRTAIMSTWTNNFYEAEIEKVVWDGYSYGTGIFKASWDSSLDGGLGNAITERVDPYTFYPDPNATSMKDANFFVQARTMSLQEMDRRWPGSAKRFSESGYQEDVDEAPTNTRQVSSFPKANPGAIAPATSAKYGLPGQAQVHATDDPGVTVLESWIREHRAVKIEEKVEGDDVPARPDPVIESWRCVVTVGQHVLMDVDARELWGHARHPFTRYVTHETGEFWGPSMVEFLIPSQVSINKLLASFQQNIELSGNPVFRESTRSGIPRQKITNKPGARVSVNDGGKADWLIPPQLQPQMFQLITFYIAEMERISGLSAIARGSVPTSRNSESVLDRIQEASFVRIRMALRNLEWALRDQGQLCASLIVENYTLPRMISVIGQSGEKTLRALNARHFYLPTAQGATPLKFQLQVEGASSLPLSRDAWGEKANNLFAMGAIDNIEVLKAHGWPGAQEVADRVEAKKQAGLLEAPGARQRTKRSK